MPVRRGPRRATGSVRASTATRASSPSSPRPSGRSRPPPSAARSGRAAARPTRSSPSSCARNGPASRRTPRRPRPSAPRCSPGSRASPRSWRRRPPATPRCSRCWPTAPSCPRRRSTSRTTCSAGPAASRDPEPEPEPEAGRRHRPRQRAASSRRPSSRSSSPTPSSPRTSRRWRHRRPAPTTNRLGSWELLTPLFRAFEYGGDATCMPLPEPTDVVHGIRGLELMHHQAQVVAAAAAGHRTFLLADEPGLGKTAQALLAADAADAFPLARRRAERRQGELGARGRAVDARAAPPRSSTATARPIDGFADIVIVNYEILDRHVGWLGQPRLPRHGRRRGALHQEQVLAALAARPRARPSASAPATPTRCSWRSPAPR